MGGQGDQGHLVRPYVVTSHIARQPMRMELAEERRNKRGGGVLPRGDCGPCPSELAARRLREEDARKDFIGKVPPVFASHTAGNSGRSRGRWKRGPRPAGGSGATSGGVVLQPLRPGEGTTAQRPATGAAQGISFLDILPRGINTPQYCRPRNREFSHVFIPRYPCEVLLPPHVPMIATSRVSI